MSLLAAASSYNIYGKDFTSGNFLVENVSGFNVAPILSNAASLGITSNSTIQFEKASLLTANTCNIAFYSDDISAYNVFSTNVSASVSNAPAGSLFRIESNAVSSGQPAVLAKIAKYAESPYTYRLPNNASNAVRNLYNYTSNTWFVSSAADYAALLTAAEISPTLQTVSGYVSGSVPISVVSTIANVTYSAKVDGGDAISMPGGACTLTGLSEGSHTVVVTATNGYVSSSTSVSFVEDSIAPSVSGVTLASGPDADGYITVTFSSSDTNSMSYATSIDGGATWSAASASPDTIHLPIFGTYSVKVKVTDAAGNVGTSSSLSVKYAPAEDQLTAAAIASVTSIDVKTDVGVQTVPVKTPEQAAAAPPDQDSLVVVNQGVSVAPVVAAATVDNVGDIKSAVTAVLNAGASSLLVTGIGGIKNTAAVVADIADQSLTPIAVVSPATGSAIASVDTSQLPAGSKVAVAAAESTAGNQALYYRVLDSDGNVVTSGFELGMSMNLPGITGDYIKIEHFENGGWVYITTGVRQAGTDDFDFSVGVNDVVQGSQPTAPDTMSAPTIVSVGNGSVTLSWTAPSDGGSPITGYMVTASPGGATATKSSSYTQAIITGLANGTSYTFTVVATNAIGSSSASSASASATPSTVPGAPTSLAASELVVSGRVPITWSAPANNGGSAITGYTITISGGGISRSPITQVGTSYTYTGLTNGTEYTISVVVNNANGSSSEVSTTATPTGPPDAPTLPSGLGAPPAAVPHKTSVDLSWVPALLNTSGLPTLGYVVVNGSDIPIESTAGATSVTVTGLSSGTSYTYYVKAINANGSGPRSPAITFTTLSSATGSGDPYISTLDGKLYKLPSFNGHIRLYQGEVGGKLLTVNATTKIDDDKTAMDADTEEMNSRLAKPVQRDLQMTEAMSFFERFHIDYAGETMVVNVYDGFKVEKAAASWPVEVVGNVQKFLKAFSFYEHLAGEIVEISPCPEVVLRIGIVPIRHIRNSVEIIAPNMAAGNGVFVHRMSRKAMTLRKLEDVKPVEKKDAAVKRTFREAFVCDAKTTTVNIPYVG